MVTLREINNDNFSECIKLEVDESQKNFVANYKSRRILNES